MCTPTLPRTSGAHAFTNAHACTHACTIHAPHELQGSLGGFFTSVEGLLEKIRAHLQEGNPFGTGE